MLDERFQRTGNQISISVDQTIVVIEAGIIGIIRNAVILWSNKKKSKGGSQLLFLTGCLQLLMSLFS